MPSVVQADEDGQRLMSRDFLEERRFQLVREQLRRITPPEIEALYRQNPLLDFLMSASPKEIVAYRRRFLAEQKAAGNILPPND